MDLVLKGKCLIDPETGEIFCDDIKARFSHYTTFDAYYRDFKDAHNIRFLDCMGAQELEEVKLVDILSQDNHVAEQKWNGHRMTLSVTLQGNRIFSRSLSKKTEWYGESSDQLPHLRDYSNKDSLIGTIIDGELTVPVPGCDHRDVQGVTGALPENALKYQLEKGFAELNAFDILYYKGVNIQKKPYWLRKLYLYKVIQELNHPFVHFSDVYVVSKVEVALKTLYTGYKDYNTALEMYKKFIKIVPSYIDLYTTKLEEGWEGLILKDFKAPYEQKRSKHFIKMKAHKMYDCVIIGYEEPTEDFDGKTKLDDWLFWEDYEGDTYVNGKPKGWNESEYRPVTKFYAMGWIGALVLGVYNDKGQLQQVTKCSGLDDATRQLISENKNKFLNTVVEVESQGILDKKTGSLQNPRFSMFREDKNAEDCTLIDHLRRYKEA